MNEEIMVINEEIEDAEVMDIIEEPEVTSNGNLGKLVVGAAIVGVGAVAAIIYKNRDKFEQKKIAKLRKKGYVVVTPEELDAMDAEIEEECDETEDK